MDRILTFLLLLVAGLSAAQSAVVKGSVRDATNNDPVPFAQVRIVELNIGAESDEEGNYTLENLTPGLYNFEATAFGYELGNQLEIEVSSAKVTFLNFELTPAIGGTLDSVVITTNPFSKSEESPVSLRSMQASEIARYPGGNRDISKVIQALPGAAPSVSFRNDIIIRGGAPNENRFYLDGIEVPNINHFATQGSSGGPVGLLNVNFIDKVDFYSGAFPANRGNTLSSVFEFRQKEGNPDKLETTFAVGSSDVGATFDGPIGDKTSFIFSARRSYLQALFKVLKLPFLPTYNDAQLKVKHQFNNKNQLTIIGLGAFDQFVLNQDVNEGETDASTLERNNYLLGNLPENGQWNYTVGANYRHFMEKGYLTVVLSRNHLNNTAKKYQNNDDSNPGNLVQDYQSEEIENKLRLEQTLRTRGWKINFGIGAETVKYTNRTFNQIYTNQGAQTIDFDSELNFNRWALFSQFGKKILNNKLTLSLGLRTDFNDYSREMRAPIDQLSPRLSVSYMLTDRFGINANVGRYYQLPAYTVMGYRNATGVLINQQNKITYIGSTHYVAGLEYNTDSKARITIEGFYKTYDNYPFLLRDSISIANLGADFGVIGNEPAVSTSEGRSMGVEFLMQQKLFKGFFGIVAYTFVTSEFKDKNGVFQPSAWDSKHIVSLTAGKKFKKNWDLGVRWLFSGGAPYTPFAVVASSQVTAWDVRGQGIPDYDRLNTLRLRAFHQLDVRVDKKWFFQKWSLNLYLDIQNLYNFQAEQSPFLNMRSDANGNLLTDPNDPSRYVPYTIENVSGNVLPTIGIVLEL